MLLLDRLTHEEGFRSHPYDDATSEPWKNGQTIKGKLTIGYGFNIDTSGPGLTEEEAQAVLQIRLGHLRATLASSLPWTSTLDEVRFDVLEDMAYNMGIQGLLGFHRMLTMLEAGNYEGAAQAGLESAWAGEEPDRSHALMEQLRTGLES